ncbi:AAA domain-containing protein [Micromonospora globispora]|uniref:AAA domain-containing protein n=1 Tax=Micromonospora globispora TaxID=1450148 RepID=UPI0021AB5A8C|nr:AAA domain-containing protein [Micromonospora globispora]
MLASVADSPEGWPVRSSVDLDTYLAAADPRDRDEPFTYVIDPGGLLLLVPRRSEDVACAGGGEVLGAGEIAFAGERDGWVVTEVDEAYQMCSDALLRVAGRFERALFVGDPGQLDPFSTVETARWTGLTWDPMQSAVATLLRHNPQLPVHRLPVSWRLPVSAAPVVAAAFYPFTGFRAGTGPADRALTFTEAGPGDGYDAAVEVAAESGWALYELPARHTLRTDAEAAAACAELALRVLRRGAVAVSEQAPQGAPVTADRIAVGAAHRDQVAAIRWHLGAAGAGITVDTANRLQGREYDVTIVLHPLSGRRDATAFHLESGRLCVLTSRHRHACVVVARAGIPELLDAHPSTERVHPDVPVKFPDGWEANQTMLAHLAAHTVP